MRITEQQAATILRKAEILAGESLGENGAALVEMAVQRALTFCGREDIPAEMEQAVAALAAEMRSGEAGVKSVQRGDTSITYDVSRSGATALLTPFCRLSTVRGERR